MSPRRINAELLANLVNAAEIARRVGISRAAVSNWSARGVGFPEPVVRLQYDWREVAAWLSATGRPTTPAPRITPEHEALHAHRKSCLVCARSLDRRQMCSIGQQLRDDVTSSGHIREPLDDYLMPRRSWRP